VKLFSRVQSRAANASPVEMILTALAFPFYLLGWAVGAAVRLALFLIGWAVTAAQVGFVDGKGGDA